MKKSKLNTSKEKERKKKIMAKENDIGNRKSIEKTKRNQ
jgi:hypothetical protein